MFRTFALVVLVLSGSACSDEKGATEILEMLGYDAVRVDGSAILACPPFSARATAFVARNTHDNQVWGAVCCGIVEACTVRFDRGHAMIRKRVEAVMRGEPVARETDR